MVWEHNGIGAPGSKEGSQGEVRCCCLDWEIGHRQASAILQGHEWVVLVHTPPALLGEIKEENQTSSEPAEEISSISKGGSPERSQETLREGICTPLLL